MTLLVAYRPRGAHQWTHHYTIQASYRSWKALYRQARLWRKTQAYAYIRRGEYVEVL